MANYGMKISKPGYDVGTANPNELVFSSKYSTLRVRSQGSGNFTESGGGRNVTIAHNLGYVPYFIVHATPDPQLSMFAPSDSYCIDPFTPIIAGACHIDRNVYAYADDTNLYIKLGADYGYNFFYTRNSGIFGQPLDYAKDGDGGYASGTFCAGRKNGTNYQGAIRFVNVTLGKNESFQGATLLIQVGTRTGSGWIRSRIRGIDEDNTSDFSGSPFGRSLTTANGQWDTGDPNLEWINWGVDGQVQEIIARGGWSSGNAMGFVFRVEGTNPDNNNYVTTTAAQDNWFYCSASSLRLCRSNALGSYKYTIFYNQIE